MKTQVEAEVLAGQVALHAFDGHASEFGTIHRGEFEALIRDAVMQLSAVLRPLRNGRTAYWSDEQRMIVIENTNAPERSTAFHPTGGRAYFENLQ